MSIARSLSNSGNKINKKGIPEILDIIYTMLGGGSEIYFETYMPTNMASEELTIKLYRDDADIIDRDNYRNHLYPLQVYDVSVQVEGE